MASVIGEEGTPRLRRWSPRPVHEFGNGRLAHRDSQLLKLPVNAGRPTVDSRSTSRELTRAHRVRLPDGQCDVHSSTSRTDDNHDDAMRGRLPAARLGVRSASHAIGAPATPRAHDQAPSSGDVDGVIDSRRPTGAGARRFLGAAPRVNELRIAVSRAGK